MGHLFDSGVGTIVTILLATVLGSAIISRTLRWVLSQMRAELGEERQSRERLTELFAGTLNSQREDAVKVLTRLTEQLTAVLGPHQETSA